VIRSRLDTYDKNTNPIAEFYKSVRENQIPKGRVIRFLSRKKNILQEFHGRESDKIWPEVKKYLDRVLNEPPARKQGA
jgi:adenylate kinase family enzyme